MTARDAARAVLVMDLVVGGLSRAAAEAKVTAFEQAQRTQVLHEYAQKISDDATLAIDGLNDDCCRAYGVALARWLHQQADATTPTSKEQQR